MTRKPKKAKPSNDSTPFKGGWFYEYRGRLDVVVGGGRGPILSIPWRKILAAAQRCRPEDVRHQGAEHE
jgi:hypothetical protein